MSPYRDPVQERAYHHAYYLAHRELHPLPIVTLEERVWKKVDRRGEDDCWIWLGYHNREGYAVLGVGNRPGLVHRIAYELIVGKIPDGLTIDHLCRNRGCVNPRHMEPVPNAVNVLRGQGVTAKNARKSHCPRGHAYAGANLNIRNGKRRCVACDRSWRRRAQLEAS